MNNVNTTTSDPSHTFVGIADLKLRWGRGRSTVYEIVKDDDFPGPVAPGRWRFDKILDFEERVSGRRPAERRKAKRRPQSAPPAAQPSLDELAPRASRKRAS